MWWLIVILYCAILIYLRWKRRKMMKLYNLFNPNRISLPFIGHAYLFIGNSEDRMKRLKKIGEESYGKGGMISHWQGTQLFLLVSDPVFAEVVLKNCLEKHDVIKYLRTPIGNGSIFAPVASWRPRRKLVAPTFSLKNLNQFVSIFAKKSSIMVKHLKPNVGTGSFSLWKYFTSYTMDAVCETTLGIQVSSEQQSVLQFLQAFELITKVDTERTFQPWLYSDIIFQSLPGYSAHCKAKNYIFNFVDKIIESKIKKKKQARDENITESENSLKTFFDLIVESSKNTGYGNIELREETMVIVLAGTDTSAVGAAFTAVMLSWYQDVQQRCYEELMEIFGDSNRPVTTEDLPRMKYLDAVIKETLRLYPPVPFIIRKVDKDTSLPSGVTLVKDCGVFISIFAIHRNPKYWGEDAEQFRPERFLDAAPKHPAAFIPFSHGPRGCLGYQYAMMSMKTSLTTLLRSYRLLPATSSDGTSHKPLRLKFNIMMRDIDNFQIMLENRRQKR